MSRCAFTHLPTVDQPTPGSSATSRRESALINAIRTVTLRNSAILPVLMPIRFAAHHVIKGAARIRDRYSRRRAAFGIGGPG